MNSALAANKDAIAMRIYPNTKHLSALRWYQEGPFPKGSPQEMIIDGYRGIRDGRTAYVNAANVNIAAGTFYTNIYVLSFNQSAELATEDIFGRMLARWRFNTNLDIETGVCSGATSTNCLTVADCDGYGYCDNFKSKTIRDTLRMENLADIRLSLEQYAKKEKKYPDLAAGSYYPDRTISVWPSWQGTLGKKLGKNLPIDPINQLAPCAANFDPVTCWDQASKSFAWATELNAGTIPTDNFTYLYRNSNQGSSYNLCAYSETGLIPASDRCNATCLPFCFEKNCGDDRCGGSCGVCTAGQSCSASGVCTANCSSSLGCRTSFPDSVVAPGYCSGTLKCLECQPGSFYSAGACITTCSADGCNSHCPAYCTVTDDPDCSSVGCCGDSRIRGGEICDDGHAVSGDGCSASCNIEPGWTCVGEPSVCTLIPVCGNGLIEAGEACDQGGGNIAGGDGCSASCNVESGWTCVGEPSVCTLIPVCGNGLIEAGETCDQGGGNIAGGDGCGASCNVESGWTCSGLPSICSLIPPPTQTVACIGLPLEAVWNGLTTVLQTWTGTVWVPSNVGTYNATPGICTFECNAPLTWDGTACVSGTFPYCTFDTPPSSFDSCLFSPAAPSCAPNFGSVCNTGNDCKTGGTWDCAGTTCLETDRADGVACGAFDGNFYAGSCQAGACDTTCPNTWQIISNKCLLNRLTVNVDYTTANTTCNNYGAWLPSVADLNALPCNELDFRNTGHTWWGRVRTTTVTGGGHVLYQDMGSDAAGCPYYNSCGTNGYNTAPPICSMVLLWQFDTTPWGYVCLKNQ